MSPKVISQEFNAVVDPSFPPQWELDDAELLAYYLDLPPSRREELFPQTATAAVRVGVSQRTIQAWIDAGLIRAVPIGKRFRVHLESLLSYLRNCALRRAL